MSAQMAALAGRVEQVVQVLTELEHTMLARLDVMDAELAAQQAEQSAQQAELAAQHADLTSQHDAIRLSGEAHVEAAHARDDLHQLVADTNEAAVAAVAVAGGETVIC